MVLGMRRYDSGNSHSVEVFVSFDLRQREPVFWILYEQHVKEIPSYSVHTAIVVECEHEGELGDVPHDFVPAVSICAKWQRKCMECQPHPASRISQKNEDSGRTAVTILKRVTPKLQKSTLAEVAVSG